ncbi:MAG: hypothetical protein GF307_01840 [candidate division Zixibacteria bacterium]|nr:hypothetical protein [candidate division Zixibacteria bacterium]
MPVEKKHLYYIAAGLILVGIFYFWHWGDAPIISPDVSEYMHVAQDLRDLDFDELSIRIPGYPIILLLTGHSQEPPGRFFYFLQLFATLGAVFVLIYLLYELSAPLYLIYAFALIAVMPVFIGSAGWAITEVFAQIFLIFGLAGLILWLWNGTIVWLIIYAILIPYCGLIRPSLVLLPAGIIMILSLYRWLFPAFREIRGRLITAITAIAISTLIIIGGMLVHNYVKFDYPGLSTRLIYNLPNKTLRVLEKLPDEYSEIREVLVKHRDRKLTERHGLHDGYDYIFGAYKELKAKTGLSDRELSSLLIRLNIYLIKTNLISYLEEFYAAAAEFWIPHGQGGYGNNYPRILLAAAGAGQVVIFALFFLCVGFAAVLAFLPNRARANLSGESFLATDMRLLSLILSVISILYHWITTSAVALPHARYRAAVDILILFVVILGIDSFARFRRAIAQPETK